MTTPPPGSVQSAGSVPPPQEGIDAHTAADAFATIVEYLTGHRVSVDRALWAAGLLRGVAARPAPPTPTQAEASASPERFVPFTIAQGGFARALVTVDRLGAVTIASDITLPEAIEMLRMVAPLAAQAAAAPAAPRAVHG